ncbi:hypothetical protein DL98DRAFT_136727 [Cadophora sp. DSE1049]|nr:hypothetical protein DL98DRAFT_136727 [Cadophora sp. DSE1049]
MQNPHQALKMCEPSYFKTYLFWRVKHSRIKKESSIITRWKILSMVYARLAEEYMKEGVLYDMRNWIPQVLTPAFGLDDSEKEKSGLFVEDLCRLQNAHWVRDTEVFAHERLRVQLSPFLSLAGCTATRPKALVGLRYEDIEFQLFPPRVKGRPPIVIMKLNLNRVKRSGGKRKRKGFAFYEAEDLACCGVTFMLALALADGAFKNKLTSLRDVYSLVVPPDTDRIRLQWDEDWAQRPVFRDVEHTANGVRVSRTKALDYQKHRHHLIRLGRTSGFEKKLEFYDLRRASGKRLKEALTPEEHRQIMGHRGDVYERYYMPSFIDRDCQAIYLGSTRRDDLIRAVGRLICHERAPKALTDVQKFEISQDPKLLELIEERAQCVRDLKDDGFPTIKSAKETKWFEKHKSIQAEINTLRRKLKDDLLEKSIAEFHKTVHTAEVDRQLRGIRPADIITPPNFEYELEERGQVAKLLFKPLDGLAEGQILDVRVELVDNLMRLCKKQETPHQYKAPKKRGRPKVCPVYASTDADDEDEDEDDDEGFSQGETDVESDVDWETKTLADEDLDVDSIAPIEVEEQPIAPPLYCAFCKWVDEEAGPQKRGHVFSRIDSLSRHIRAQHLCPRAAGEGFDCPYQGCSAFIGSALHFITHTKHQHGLRL